MPADVAGALRPEWLAGEIAVVGLARSGRSVARLLARSGARVYASDAGHSADLDATAEALAGESIDVQVGAHDTGRIARASLVVASPGVPPNAPPFAAARNAGVPIVSEVEIGLRFLPNLAYIAVTGTNGKTTTTALIAHLLTAVGRNASAAGNIGTPISELPLLDTPPDWVALELSSFQLHDTPSVAPSVGVLTNLSANHLDRYASADEYFADKALMFRNARADSRWVTNADDAAVQAMASTVPGNHTRFSVEKSADGFWDREGNALFALGTRLVAREEFPLLGDHNVANALAAALAVLVADPAHRTDVAIEAMRAALRTFAALEHRIETVGEADGVVWIDDSKSTSVASALVALQSMTRPTILLLGGRHKGEPYTSLIPELARHTRAVIAYGEAAAIIESDLKGDVPVTRLGSSFTEVIAAARSLAQRGDAVLLSPACSSYDMFDNYEQRGSTFKQLALAAQ